MNVDNGAGGPSPSGKVRETCVAGEHDRCTAWRDCGCPCHEMAAELDQQAPVFFYTAAALWVAAGVLAGLMLAKLPAAGWSLETVGSFASGAMFCWLLGWAGLQVARIDPGDDQTWTPALFVLVLVLVPVRLARAGFGGVGRLLNQRGR